jgi:hypothetical protein
LKIVLVCTFNYIRNKEIDIRKFTKIYKYSQTTGVKAGNIETKAAEMWTAVMWRRARAFLIVAQ